MTVVEPGAMSSYLHGAKGSDVIAARSAPKHNIFDPSFQLPADMIMGLLASKAIKWRESADAYFRTVNPSLSVVHADLFYRAIEGLGPDEFPKDPEVALLLVCMHLINQYTDTTSPLLSEGKEMMKLPAYIVAKRVLGILRSLSEPSIPLIQSAILLGLYEFGHGNVRRAYATIGDASTMARLLGLRPGKYVPADKDSSVIPEDEERRSLYWVLFIVDR